MRGASAAPHAAAFAHVDALDAPVRLRASCLKKRYRKGNVEIPVLRGVDLEVGRGEFLSIIGQSGSGKSTLLHLLGTLDAPDGGEVHFDGGRIDNLPAAERDALRNKTFGMIFQFYHLLPELTALENVLSPLMIAQGVLCLSPASACNMLPGPRNCSKPPVWGTGCGTSRASCRGAKCNGPRLPGL